MSKPIEYEEYLNSPEWRGLKSQARERANNQCEFCGGAYYAVHHVNYPKVFSCDCLDNLVVVCRRCHELCHGIRRGGRVAPLGVILDQMFQELYWAEL